MERSRVLLMITLGSVLAAEVTATLAAADKDATFPKVILTALGTFVAVFGTVLSLVTYLSG